MNKKILFSLMSVVVLASMMGAATFAAFSSAASNIGNTFGSGTLTLKINGAGGSTSSPVFAVSNAAPGYTTTQVLDLTNTGSVAVLHTKLTGISTTPSGSPDLGGKLTLDLYNDVNNDGLLDGGDTLIHAGKLNDSVGWTNVDLGFGLPATTGQHKVLAKLTFDSDADSTYQGLSDTFSFSFEADQL